MSGHGQISSCGEAQRSPGCRHPPPPSATTPTFFLCCESSKGCGRRVRRSQALEDGPQLLTGLQDMQERMDVPLLALEGPPGLLRPPFPQAVGRREGSHRGPHRQEKWRQDSRVLPHGHHMSLTTQSTAPSCAPPSPSPRCLPPGPANEGTNTEGTEKAKNSTVLPTHHCPRPSGKGPNSLQSRLKTQNVT